jgi:hypothetical protein
VRTRGTQLGVATGAAEITVIGLLVLALAIALTIVTHRKLGGGSARSN